MTQAINLSRRLAARRVFRLLVLCGAIVASCGSLTASDFDRINRDHHVWDESSSPSQKPSQKPAIASHVPWQRAPHDCVRAGDPHRVSWFAKPSRNKRDTVGYVGGNAAWRGEPRQLDEGTWGLDYAGLFSRNHIWLQWLHGRPSHQSDGSYTDLSLSSPL